MLVYVSVCLCVCREACKKNLDCDYYFSIDSDVAVVNNDILRLLIEENKYGLILIPLRMLCFHI